MAELTFRDFAGAIMGGDTARAAEVLGALLGVDTATGTSAGTHFQTAMKADPAFMSKAIGLRAAVTGGSDEDIGVLLGDCFGLTNADLPSVIATLRKQYPAS